MRKIWLCTIGLVFFGCIHKPERQKFIEYIDDPDNKITQQISIGEVQTTVKWLPRDYRRLKGQEQDTTSHGEEDYYYFDVKFDKVKGDKPSKEKVLYLDFDMEKDFVLLSRKDSLLPAICQKIENGISGCYEYLLVFQNPEPEREKEDFMLVYNDKIFATGIQAFVYEQKDIRKIPLLKREKSK